MTRWRYYLAMGVAILFQTTLVPYAGTDMIHPNLPLLVLLVIAIRFGSFEAIIWGAAAGYIMDLPAASPLGMSAIVLALAGFVVGKVFASDILLPLNMWASASGAGIMTAALAWSALYSMGTLAPMGSVYLMQALPSAAYTWILGMLWAISPLYGRRKGVHFD